MENAQKSSPNMHKIKRTVKKITFYLEIVFLFWDFLKILTESSIKKIKIKPDIWYKIRIENFDPGCKHLYVCLKNNTITVEVIAIISANWHPNITFE